MRKAWTASVLAGLAVGALAPVALAAPGKGFTAVEIRGERVAPGLVLNAHVFYARPPAAPYACEDDNTGTAQPVSFAQPRVDGIEFSLASNVPTSWSNPLAASLATWNAPLQGSAYFARKSGSVASAARPSKFSDGTNYIGLAKIQGRALAVTYTWSARSTGRITEADVYFNSGYTWDVAEPTSTCPNGSAYDIESIATHELGHVIGLDHLNVPAATMYQSAPAGETRKRTLTAGEVSKASSLP